MTENPPEAGEAGSATADRGDLDRLARAHGIAPDYEDVWGRRHEVSDGTKRALLAAMGIVFFLLANRCVGQARD